jgi:hypothetical protein
VVTDEGDGEDLVASARTKDFGLQGCSLFYRGGANLQEVESTVLADVLDS